MFNAATACELAYTFTPVLDTWSHVYHQKRLCAGIYMHSSSCYMELWSVPHRHLCACFLQFSLVLTHVAVIHCSHTQGEETLDSLNGFGNEVCEM